METIVKPLDLYKNLCCGVLKTNPRDYQLQISEKILDSVLSKRGDTICTLVSRQGGKNHTVIDSIIFLATQCPGIKIGLYAPTYDQALISSRRLRSKLTKLGIRIEAITTENNTKVIQFKFINGSEGPYAWRGEGSLIGIYSHAPQTSKEGQTWDLIIIDEAQDLDKEVFQVEIEPMGASTNATYVFIGTPWSEDSLFFEKIQFAKRNGTYLEFPWEAVAACLPDYSKFIAKKKEELGENSVAFLTQYCLQWLKGLGMFFNYDSFLESNVNESRTWQISPTLGKEYAFGLDIAGDDKNNTGQTDYTVFTVVEVDRSKCRTKDDKPETTLVFYKRWHGEDWDKQYNEICALINRWRPSAGVGDNTGAGSYLMSRLEKKYKNIERFDFSERSKSDLGHYVDAEVKAGRAKIAKCRSNSRTLDNWQAFLLECRYLKRENKPKKVISYYVSADRGNDDIMMSWFMAQKAAANKGRSYQRFLKAYLRPKI